MVKIAIHSIVCVSECLKHTQMLNYDLSFVLNGTVIRGFFFPPVWKYLKMAPAFFECSFHEMMPVSPPLDSRSVMPEQEKSCISLDPGHKEISLSGCLLSGPTIL